MTPAVTEPKSSMLMGLPMATASSPTSSSPESPKTALGSPLASTLSTARSVWRSLPTTLASNSCPSLVMMDSPVPSSMTWALVTRYPFSLRMMPEP